MKSLLVVMGLFVGLLIGSSAFAQAVIELPPGGSTTVGATTVICMKSRVTCRLHRHDGGYEIRSDEEVLATFAKLSEALAWLKEMRLSGACQ